MSYQTIDPSGVNWPVVINDAYWRARARCVFAGVLDADARYLIACTACPGPPSGYHPRAGPHFNSLIGEMLVRVEPVR